MFLTDEKLYGKEYKGYIKVKLWINHDWITVSIDDRLPTLESKLCYSCCEISNHFWVPLLEKAFAKLIGSYKDLDGIDSAFVLSTLTSGMVLRFNPINLNHREQIIHYLNTFKKIDFLLAIIGSELINDSNPVEKLNNTNTRIGHSFSIIDILKTTSGKYLLKLRNSQNSMKILKVSESNIDNKEIINSEKENGVFAINFEELFEYFEILTIVVTHDPKIEGKYVKLRLRNYFKLKNNF